MGSGVGRSWPWVPYMAVPGWFQDDPFKWSKPCHEGGRVNLSGSQSTSQSSVGQGRVVGAIAQSSSTKGEV